ncbi:ubiE/COQ5 methyltransferase family [Seminavis robusta]|uniref:UbiE/COQ5 methyltransferase family n=1 Tax=Seminavis robusta TaxID=568900 RepID=A0A9N8ES55_9STRA|nr:ubiE/COQ5 methyltransferase family [Seminavis robusta]|eukprot:Sro1947_g307130.1 ubiE/COQ5 methyltransferase family (353) ;mRNA; f:7421-8479
MPSKIAKVLSQELERSHNMRSFLFASLVAKHITIAVSVQGFTPQVALPFRHPALNRFSSTAMTASSHNNADKWSEQADLYSDHSARLTELHGADLVTLLKEDILKAKTILDIGCGTGAFAKAYLQQFPNGVPGQTLISSDHSEGMMLKAKETVVPPSESFQTKLVFQQEDGTKLEGISDGSVDMVVSLFGVFLIPDQAAACQAIQRVLKKEGGVVAIASWQFGLSDFLADQGFGVSLQDAFQLPSRTIDPNLANFQSIANWSSREGATKMLSEEYQLKKVEIHGGLHTILFDFDYLWKVICQNPMSNTHDASEEDLKRTKEALIQFVTRDGKHSIDKPLLYSTASFLCIGRG